MGRADVINVTRKWVEDVVVGYKLCPFAGRELSRERVRFVVSAARTEDELLQDLHVELQLLDDEPDIETTLLIHPSVLQSFELYNAFLSVTDGLLEYLNMEGIYQIASFHPDYQFEGTQPDSAENYTNRSPYPMLHLLREASVETAIAQYPGIDDVPERNIELMEELGAEKMKAILENCRHVAS
jgi:hypothetical protein